MHLCHRDEVMSLAMTGGLKIEVTDRAEPIFLDEHRLGLRVAELRKLCGEIDLTSDAIPHTRVVDLTHEVLLPGRRYLGITRERIALGEGYVATIHTRSRYARIGLELLGSSNFIVPGFGTTQDTPIVLEVSVALPTSGVNSEECYGFLLIFRVDSPREWPNLNEYHRRFPIWLPKEKT